MYSNAKYKYCMIVHKPRICRLHGPYLLSPGCIENPRSSVIGLFRRESTSSTHMSSCESSPGSGVYPGGRGLPGTSTQEEGHPQQRSQSQQIIGSHHHANQSSQHGGPSAVILIEEREADPLGVLQPATPLSAAHLATPTTSAAHTTMSLPRPSSARRGSMLELPTGSVSMPNDQNNGHNSI